MKKLSLSILILLLAIGQIVAQVNNSLIAHYKLDGNAQDASINHIHGIIKGNVTVVPDRFGNPCGAMNFDGSTGYIEVPHNNHFNSISNSFTITAWTKLDVNADNWWITICSKGNQLIEGASSPHFRFQMTKLTVSWNTGYVPSWQQDYDKDKWYFWAITCNGKQVDVYKNGVNVGSYNNSNNLVSNNFPLDIGRDNPGNAEYFWGAIDDLRIYNSNLSKKDIKTIFKEVPQVVCNDGNTKKDDCNFPSTINNTDKIQYSLREYSTNTKKLRIFADDNINIQNTILINFNGQLQSAQTNLTKHRMCIYEMYLKDKCNYILFKSVNGLAVFNLEIEGTPYGTIECDKNTFYGIKIIYE